MSSWAACQKFNWPTRRWPRRTMCDPSASSSTAEVVLPKLAACSKARSSERSSTPERVDVATVGAQLRSPAAKAEPIPRLAVPSITDAAHHHERETPRRSACALRSSRERGNSHRHADSISEGIHRCSRLPHLVAICCRVATPRRRKPPILARSNALRVAL
eukprot:scaffold6705_cov31-Tisochrysis_lutea.AAC.4